MYFVSLNFTSPTFVASMLNTIAALTFVLAVILRLEVVNVQDPRGIAKVIGTLVSLGGVMIMTLYKGVILKNLWHPIIYIHQGGNNVVKENWVKGSILTVASCIAWSIWFIMQAYTLKRYPAQLSLTTWMSFVGAAQSAFYTIVVQHKRVAWTIGFNIDFWSIMYGDLVPDEYVMAKLQLFRDLVDRIHVAVMHGWTIVQKLLIHHACYETDRISNITKRKKTRTHTALRGNP
ncbi:hypothetical protein FXO38_11468 [Capsicum annuum]|nr:hypothetical protein FXO38_11468 [Capsicum annuum]